MAATNTSENRNCSSSKYIYAAVSVLAMLLALLVIPEHSVAEPLEYNPFATIGLEARWGRLDGRLGFAQDTGETGTLNDFVMDLGLPRNTMTWGVQATARPLEHHLVRIFGYLPETYKGGTTLNRALTTRNFTYAAGTSILSEFKTAMFGFGYDLDFLVGPKWYGGLHGNIRHMLVQVRMGNAASGREDTLSIAETVPCLGAHMQTRNTFEFGPGRGNVNLGGFARMNFSMTPNFMNYFDVTAGVAVGFRVGMLAMVETKIGYHYESYYHDQEVNGGKILELRRDGILLSLEGLF
ncbi:MAG: hypothetical protein HY912_21120 [Desulfomonile tiedjei]|uniref:Uncharacterized protein n=1 Tax=Desulfomonile tiedjei TaxID=2358 RepID=A0A9D6V786_9BACT|nr:hypothetical protein [Desulfomonile tiedjei]